MNIATFAGRVGSDAELIYTKSGKAVAKFSIAIDQGKDAEGEKKAPLWIRATLWEKRAESLSPYIKKGSFVIVSGPVTVEAWTSKKSGEAEASIAVSVREFTFGGGSKDERQGDAPRPQAAQAPASQPQGAAPIDSDDIPF